MRSLYAIVALTTALLDAVACAEPTTVRVSLNTDTKQLEGSSRRPSISNDGSVVAFLSRSKERLLRYGVLSHGEWAYVFDSKVGKVVWLANRPYGNMPTASVSGDGRRVAFQAQPQPPSVVVGWRIHILDREAATTAPVCGWSDGHTQDPSFSVDGHYLSFYSHATNLVSGDTNGVADVFLYNLVERSVARVSVSSTGEQADKGSDHSSVNADGRYVAFQSEATNLVIGDTNGCYDIFVRDLRDDNTTCVSRTRGGTVANGHSSRPSISGDGRFVVFASDATNFIAGDTNGYGDVFLHDRKFSVTRRVSLSTGGVQGNGESYCPAISANGRYVAYYSNASNLVSGDTNATTDVFLHDRVKGITSRVSVSTSGGQGTGTSGDIDPPAISSDGRFVAFTSSASNLVPDDSNDATDVFLRGPLF